MQAGFARELYAAFHNPFDPLSKADPKAAAKKPVPKKAAAEKKSADGKSDEAKSGKKAAPTARHLRKALKVQKKVVKGTHGTRVKKVRTTVHFKRPKTFRPDRQPKFPRKAIPRRNR